MERTTTHCPVIVRLGCDTHRDELGREGIWHTSENRCEESFAGVEGDCFEQMARCDSAAGITHWTGNDGAVYLAAGCIEGHTVSEMQRDVNLDLDGIPLNA